MTTEPRLESDLFLILFQTESKFLDMWFLLSSKHEPSKKKENAWAAFMVSR